MNPIIILPEAVIQILQELEEVGYDAYVVGGYVRDQILNNETGNTIADDFDFATSATPEELKQVFINDKIFSYGEKHGTLTIRRNGVNYEFTTFREEEGYSDGRRPDKVTFVRDLSTDLGRRDFTVNAFALNKDGTIIDHYNGLEDLDNRIIRSVGDPVKRLQEDSLRIFRAIRFAVKLGFNIEEKTKEAIRENRNLVLEHQLSGERIFTELNLIIKNLPRGVMLLHELNLFSILFPEFGDNEDIDWLFQLLKNRKYQDNQPSSDVVNWAILLHYLLKDVNSYDLQSKVQNIFTRFPGMGNEKIEYITHLLIYVRSLFNIVNLNKEVLQSVILTIIDTLNPKTNPREFLNTVIKLLRIVDDRWGITNIEKLENDISDILPKLELKMPLNGKDLISNGFSGRAVGILLKLLKFQFINDGNLNTKHLLNYINHFNYNRSILILENYLINYQLNPEEVLDDFVIESLISKMKSEYQILTNKDHKVIIELQKINLQFITPFLRGIKKKNVLLYSKGQLEEKISDSIKYSEISQFGLKHMNKKSIETLTNLNIVDPQTIIFNVK